MLTEAARADIAGHADAIWAKVRAAFPPPCVVSLDDIKELVGPTAVAVFTVYGQPGYELLQHLVATRNLDVPVAVPGLEPGNPPL